MWHCATLCQCVRPCVCVTQFHQSFRSDAWAVKYVEDQGCLRVSETDSVAEHLNCVLKNNLVCVVTGAKRCGDSQQKTQHTVDHSNVMHPPGVQTHREQRNRALTHCCVSRLAVYTCLAFGTHVSGGLWLRR